MIFQNTRNRERPDGRRSALYKRWRWVKFAHPGVCALVTHLAVFTILTSSISWRAFHLTGVSSTRELTILLKGGATRGDTRQKNVGQMTAIEGVEFCLLGGDEIPSGEHLRTSRGASLRHRGVQARVAQALWDPAWATVLLAAVFPSLPVSRASPMAETPQTLHSPWNIAA